MDINPIQGGQSLDPVKRTEPKTKSTDAKKRTDIFNANSKPSVSESLSTAIASARVHIDQAEEVRQEKVEEVRQKIKDGYYNSEEFADNLADKILQDPDLGIL